MSQVIHSTEARRRGVLFYPGEVKVKSLLHRENVNINSLGAGDGPDPTIASYTAFDLTKEPRLEDATDSADAAVAATAFKPSTAYRGLGNAERVLINFHRTAGSAPSGAWSVQFATWIWDFESGVWHRGNESDSQIFASSTARHLRDSFVILPQGAPFYISAEVVSGFPTGYTINIRMRVL